MLSPTPITWTSFDDSSNLVELYFQVMTSLVHLGKQRLFMFPFSNNSFSVQYWKMAYIFRLHIIAWLPMAIIYADEFTFKKMEIKPCWYIGHFSASAAVPRTQALVYGILHCRRAPVRSFAAEAQNYYVNQNNNHFLLKAILDGSFLLSQL
jgi:hypothetical protein